MTVGDYDRINLGKDPSGRPLVLNQRTLDMLRAAEKALGQELTLVQGSYRAGNGAIASGTTHDAGGVIDLRTWDLNAKWLTINRTVEALRRVGFAAWHRTRAQGFDDHIHAAAIGDKELSDSAKAQVVAYRAGRNGLANGGYDDGPHVGIVTWEQVRPAPDWGKPLTLFLRMPKGPVHTHWTKVAQRHLGIPATGVFSKSTRATVRAYRRRHGIRPYVGVIGPRVWARLLRGARNNGTAP